MSDVPAPENPPNTAGQAKVPTREARALIGWLAVQEGALWLAGRQAGQPEDAEAIAKCEQAREAVAQRAAGVNQDGIISDLPASLDAHLETLRQDPRSAAIVADSGEVKLVDLSKVCAAQPHIHVEDAIKRVEGLSAADLQGIAAVTLPVSTPVQLLAGYDSAKQTWTISSPNPNLRVAGNFSADVGAGMIGYGFAVTISNSYVHVARLEGRYFLRDGYHRAYGLLAAGIRYVPAFVKEYNTFEEVGLPAGLLPLSAYLGDRPPFIGDYLDDQVSAQTRLSITQKLVVVQGLELHTLR